RIQKDGIELQCYIEKVSGLKPKLLSSTSNLSVSSIIVGTLGKSALIDQLVKDGKIDQTALKGKCEKFITTIVEHPTEDMESALVIVGSDKRGTIYGLYDLSTQIGISPWHFWSDVPAKKHQSLYVAPGIHTMGEPEVGRAHV